MINISLQLPEELLKESARCARDLHLSRAEYFRKAVQHMNRSTRAGRLAETSKRIRGESIQINAEFESFESDPDD